MIARLFLSSRNELYYLANPLIPRRFQIYFRRKLVRRQLGKCGDVWPIDEKAGRAPAGWPGWPGGKKFALVLTHDVDTEKDQDRCRELAALEERSGFQSSFNFVPERYGVSPEMMSTRCITTLNSSNT